ncbi:MAG: DUF2304 domain-containing protein [Minisyncoccota bacterium]
MTFSQLILICIALIFLGNGILKFIQRERGQTFFKFCMTLIIWGFVAFFAVFPGTAREISLALGLGENLNTLIFIGFVITFIILFKFLSILERLEHDISEIIRKEALTKIKKK